MPPAGPSGAGLTIKVGVRWLSVALLTEYEAPAGPAFYSLGGALAVSLIPPETARNLSRTLKPSHLQVLSILRRLGTADPDCN